MKILILSDVVPAGELRILINKGSLIINFFEGKHG